MYGLWVLGSMLIPFGMSAQGSMTFTPSNEVVSPPDTLAVMLRRFEVPTGYDFDRLGWFCKLDVRLEQHLPFPVRFRLGEPQRVDALENKGPLRLIDPR